MAAIPIRNARDGSTFTQGPQDTLLRAALRAGLGMAHECNAGGCGACKFELLEGDIENLWPGAPGLSTRDRQRGRHLACQCRALTPLTIKAQTGPEYVPPTPPTRQTATLVATRDVTADIREFRFVASEHARFAPGQFAMLDLPGLGSSRAYSVSNTANGQGEWHFQIRRVANGLGTQVLFDVLKPGDTVGLDGPYGAAWLRTESPRDIVCVAGGSGLAPMVSIARGAAEAGLLADRKLTFFYGARLPSDVCGEDMLRALPGFGQQIQYIPVVSMPGDDGSWRGRTGFVHQGVAEVLSSAMANYEFYFAGPPLMTQALQELLMVKHGVPFEQIHFDRFY